MARTPAQIHATLKATGRGKNVGNFSYYHLTLVRKPLQMSYLEDVQRRLHPSPFEFNVVKLNAQSRVSFLRYQDFDTADFPELLAALSCNTSTKTARIARYSPERNPPILHRKELLLPADCPLVPAAKRLTQELDSLGAFKEPHLIGTRDGWSARLASLGVEVVDGKVVRR